MPEPLRLMAVHAHPDDESSKGAATLAHYVKEGVEVLVVTCTGGERGDVLNPAAQADVDALGIAEVRRQEMAEAVRILGVGHAWLGFADSGYPEGDPRPPLPAGCFADLPLDVASEPLVRLVREFRPHVITTYDENGGYPHPDHIRCHEVSMEAFTKSGDAAAYPDSGQVWIEMWDSASRASPVTPWGSKRWVIRLSRVAPARFAADVMVSLRKASSSSLALSQL